MSATVFNTFQGIFTFITPRFILIWSLFVGVLTVLHCASRDPLSKLPGPFISKLTGILEIFYYVRGYRHEYVHSLHVKYGWASGVVHFRPLSSNLVFQKQARSFGMHRDMWISPILEL